MFFYRIDYIYYNKIEIEFTINDTTITELTYNYKYIKSVTDGVDISET